jgi:hypothetical protein
VQRRGGHGRTERPHADAALGQARGQGVQRQGVVLVGRAGQQHRAAAGQLRGGGRELAQDHGGAVGEQVLDLDALAGGGPPRPDRDEHGTQHVVPGVQDAAALDLLADERGDRVRVQRHRRPAQAADGAVGAGQGQDPAPRTSPAPAEPALPVGQGRVVAGAGLDERLGERHPGGLARRDALEGEAAHGLQPGQVGGGVAAVLAGAVLARSESVAAGPRPQGRRRDAEPVGDRGDRQPGPVRRRGRRRSVAVSDGRRARRRLRAVRLLANPLRVHCRRMRASGALRESNSQNAWRGCAPILKRLGA